MSTLTQRKLLLACCASLALGFAACDDGAVNPPPPSNNCGDNVCTENQECVEGKCQDIVQDPCDACTENQECVEGKCQDIVNDPCDACTDTQQCVEGECKDLCGTEICTEEQKCDETTNTCVDKVPIEDPCDKCSESETCVNGECVEVDPCTNKTCPDNFRCDSATGGECVEIDPCENVVCNDGQTCLNAKCIDTACLENGVEKDCGEGKVCSKGECVPSGCANVTCDEGWQCLTLSCDDTGCTGQCVETACINYFCEEGRSCKGGACVDNECLDVTCDADMVCSKGTCTYEACLDKDPCTTGKTCNIEGTCVFIEEPAISLDEPEDKISDEAGKTVALALRLNNQPTQDVRVTCEVWTESPNQEVTTSCDEIVFNADNWELEQTIIVTGIDDFVKDGDQTYKIKVMTLSEDIDFAELSTESVELTNVDKTTPGITVSESALTTYEDQSQEPATFSIVLNSIPNSNVSVSFNSSKTVEGTVSPTSAKFTKDNWNVPQIITVKGTDDNSEDGNKNYTIFFGPSESEDIDYADISLPPIKVTNIDNDVAGLNVNIPAEDYTITEGQDSGILVKLSTQPKHDVKVSINIDDEEEAIASVKEITITPELWNTGIPVNLSGVVDYEIDGDQPVKITFTASSEDTSYNLEPITYNAMVKDVDKAEVVTLLGDSPNVVEGNNTFVTMSISLASKPKNSVTVALSVTDSSELKINKTTMTFSPELWDLPQDVLVNSVDDETVDGNIKSKVVTHMTSSDANFNDKRGETEFTTIDNDIAAFTIKSNPASFPENSSASTSMTIALQSQPTADVNVNITSSDASELIVSSANALTFTTSNWKTPQTVNIKVQDDHIADDTQTAYIKFVASSTDKNFNGITGQSALYTIIDDEMPSLVMTTASNTISQSSPSLAASLQLGIEPVSNVTLTLKSDSPAITFSPSTLTFTSANWNKAQNITINANFASIATASATAKIWAKATASNNYNNLENTPITLNLVKVPEVQNFSYTGTIQSVTLPKGKYKLEVWGAQGGSSGNYIGGKGGYSVGTYTIANTTTLYVVVGGNVNGKTGGYNGGGAGGTADPKVLYGFAGGGATHIATATGLLSTLSGNQNAVLIVAGGGGGADSNAGPTDAGEGGGLSGIDSRYSSGKTTGGTQSAGGTSSCGNNSSGSFGQGGNGDTCGGGGGGGWYGGGGYSCGYPGAGGSGYLSPNLTSANTIAGNVSIPSPNGGTETGHAGNGYARITIIP